MKKSGNTSVSLLLNCINVCNDEMPCHIHDADVQFLVEQLQQVETPVIPVSYLAVVVLE